MFCRDVLNQRLPHITKTRHQTPKQLTTSPSWFISFFSILTPTYSALLYFFGHTLTFVSQLHMFHTTIKWTEDSMKMVPTFLFIEEVLNSVLVLNWLQMDTQQKYPKAITHWVMSFPVMMAVLNKEKRC